MAYYKCNKATSREVNEVWEGWEDVLTRARRLSRKCGGHRSKVYYIGSLGRLYVTGFIFKTPPDPKQWMQNKHYSDCWTPKKSNKAVRTEFDKLCCYFFTDVCKILGLNTRNSLSAKGGGFVMHQPGVMIRDGIAYISISDDWGAVPKGARRISDLTYEKAQAMKGAG